VSSCSEQKVYAQRDASAADLSPADICGEVGRPSNPHHKENRASTVQGEPGSQQAHAQALKSWEDGEDKEGGGSGDRNCKRYRRKVTGVGLRAMAVILGARKRSLVHRTVDARRTAVGQPDALRSGRRCARPRIAAALDALGSGSSSTHLHTVCKPDAYESAQGIVSAVFKRGRLDSRGALPCLSAHSPH